jgi:flagellin
MISVRTNVTSLVAQASLSSSAAAQSKSMTRLSSGLRVQSAADDAAGLAISEGLRSQIGGLKVGVRNAQDGISVAQTAEGALTEVHSMLQRMNDLSVQHNSGTQSTESKAALSAEFDALNTEITRIKDNTKFNGVALFAGTAQTFQVGYDNADTIDVSATAVRAHHQQRERRGGEPLRVGEPDPRHGHGSGDGELQPLEHPAAGRHLHAGAGQPGHAGRPAAAPVI